MTDSEIRKLCDEIEEYCSKATKGPWEEGAYKDGEDGEVRCCVLGFRPSDDDGNAETEVVVAGAEGNTPQDSMDMEFISRARVDLPKLVAALREKIDAERWIPVNPETMPKIGQKCLVVWGGHVQHCAYEYAGKTFQLPESIGACIGGEDMPADEVSAWRPLPESPEVKG